VVAVRRHSVASPRQPTHLTQSPQTAVSDSVEDTAVSEAQVRASCRVVTRPNGSLHSVFDPGPEAAMPSHWGCHSSNGSIGDAHPPNWGRPVNVVQKSPTRLSAFLKPPPSITSQPSIPADINKPRLAGPMLKQSGGLFASWQLRWFSIGQGFLKWWGSPFDAACLAQPHDSISLEGAKVTLVAGSTTRLAVHSAHAAANSGKVKVYLLDTSVSTAVKKANWGPAEMARCGLLTRDVWVQALLQEAETCSIKRM